MRKSDDVYCMIIQHKAALHLARCVFDDFSLGIIAFAETVRDAYDDNNITPGFYGGSQ